jgi:ribonuclease HI
MPEFDLLLSAAFKSEIRASRHMSERTGRSPEEALRATLAAAAGAGTLTGLVDQRIAAKRADEDRASARRDQRAATLARRQARHDGKPTAWRAWFDGSAHPNPGDCGIGALLLGPSGQRVELSQAAGYGNSSEAEYRALIAVLESAVQNDAHGLTVYGDSKVVIDDVNGSDFAAAVSLRELRTTALALIAKLRDVTLRWVPRHKNGQADALSQLAVRAPSAGADTPA